MHIRPCTPACATVFFRYTAELFRSLLKSNSQTTGPGCFHRHMCRSHRCIFMHVVLTCEHEVEQKCTTHVGGSCEEKKTIQAPGQNRAKTNEQAHMQALHSGHSGGCLLAPLLHFSSLSLSLSPPPPPPPSFVFFSLSRLLSPFCFQKPIWGSARQENSHTDGMGGISGQFAGCGRV